jgi:hypothetical protein
MALFGRPGLWCNWNQTETQGLVLTDAIKAFEKKNPGV